MSSTAAPDTQFKSATIEWPTWIMLATVYCSWILLTLYWQSIPGWLLWLIGGYTVTLHSSLQHEAIHGHPTKNPRVNLALVWPPLMLWLPLELYYENHLRHHRTELADPALDPESFYVPAERWQALPRWRQRLLLFNNTYAGRMLIGPWLAFGQLCRREWGRVRDGDREHIAILARHLLSCAAVLYWVLAVCEMPFYVYLLAFVWPGSSMMMTRSFLEHRFSTDPGQRTVVVEGCPLTRLLFLNNNLHWVHHSYPGVAWYRLPALYRRERVNALQQNGDYRYPGYWTIARRYLFKPWTHPAWPAPESPA